MKSLLGEMATDSGKKGEWWFSGSKADDRSESVCGLCSVTVLTMPEKFRENYMQPVIVSIYTDFGELRKEQNLCGAERHVEVENLASPRGTRRQ